MYLTYRWLQEYNPCKDQLKLFKDTYPNGVELTLVKALLGLQQGFDVTWLSLFLDPKGTGSQQAFAYRCADRVNEFLFEGQLAIAKEAYDTYQRLKTLAALLALRVATLRLRCNHEIGWALNAVQSITPNVGAHAAANAARLCEKAACLEDHRADDSDQYYRTERIEQVKILVPMLLTKYPAGQPPVIG